MKKTLSFLLSTMLLTATLTACGGDSSSSTTTPSTSTNTESSTSTNDNVAPAGDADSGDVTEVEASGVIAMGGSTSVEEIISALRQVYMNENEGLDMTYSGTGSSTGVADALSGKIDVGLASRALKDSEIAEGAEAHIFAFDGIAVVVNAGNSVANISSEDLAKIYKKEITNWSELGGDDGQIVVVGRDSASGTRGAFEEILEVTDETMYDSELEATGAVISTVEGNPNAIGYVSLSAVGDNVSAISVDDVAPSEDTVKDTSYPIQRPFIFVTNSAISNPEMDAFVEWATTSEAAAEIVSDKGAVAPST